MARNSASPDHASDNNATNSGSGIDNPNITASISNKDNTRMIVSSDRKLRTNRLHHHHDPSWSQKFLESKRSPEFVVGHLSLSVACKQNIDLLYLTRDLLVEIFIRLPQKEVFRSKCVSSTWNHIISDSSFRRSYVSRNNNSSLPLVGFFHGPVCLRRDILEDLPVSPPRLAFLSTCDQQGRAIQCYTFIQKVSSFVAVTIRLISSAIPLRTSGYHYLNRACDVKALAVGFSCSEDDMMSFKVIRASIRLPQIEDNKLQIETFSSQTGKWKTSQLSFPSKFSLIPYEKCDVMGGIFYWRAKGDAVAAYDPGMGKNHVWLMRFPTTGLNGMCALSDPDGIEVWVLKKKTSQYSLSSIIPRTEWVLTYALNPEDFFVAGFRHQKRQTGGVFLSATSSSWFSTTSFYVRFPSSRFTDCLSSTGYCDLQLQFRD
ncbi:unnamed protein product [Ilex paraguariensis]|uniref:F-box domain-containing protein n=1 Tax=Ilex paraguariensis TaxID=185542 RepID=A0ABC8U5N1_9AQUA